MDLILKSDISKILSTLYNIFSLSLLSSLDAYLPFSYIPITTPPPSPPLENNAAKECDGPTQPTTKKKKKTNELKGILLSFLFLDTQEKCNYDKDHKLSEEDKLSMGSNHRKKEHRHAWLLLQPHPLLHQSQRIWANSVEEIVGHRCRGSHYRYHRSNNKFWQTITCRFQRSNMGCRWWWDECNRPKFLEKEFKKVFRMGRIMFDSIYEELNSMIANIKI